MGSVINLEVNKNPGIKVIKFPVVDTEGGILTIVNLLELWGERNENRKVWNMNKKRQIRLRRDASHS